MTDSYIKLANDLFGGIRATPLFESVARSDLNEVTVGFALFVLPYIEDHADAFRVTPTDSYSVRNLAKHQAKQTCCGQRDSAIRCRSGRHYLIGFNYGH